MNINKGKQFQDYTLEERRMIWDTLDQALDEGGHDIYEDLMDNLPSDEEEYMRNEQFYGIKFDRSNFKDLYKIQVINGNALAPTEVIDFDAILGQSVDNQPAPKIVQELPIDKSEEGIYYYNGLEIGNLLDMENFIANNSELLEMICNDYDLDVSNGPDGDIDKELIGELLYDLFERDPENEEYGISFRKSEDDSFKYQLLGRLKSDLDFYFGYGNRLESHLWAGSFREQIERMKELYNELEVKPDWLTPEDIQEYIRYETTPGWYKESGQWIQKSEDTDDRLFALEEELMNHRTSEIPWDKLKEYDALMQEFSGRHAVGNPELLDNEDARRIVDEYTSYLAWDNHGNEAHWMEYLDSIFQPYTDPQTILDSMEEQGDMDAYDDSERVRHIVDTLRSIKKGQNMTDDAGKPYIANPIMAVQKCTEYQQDNKLNGLMSDQIMDLTGNHPDNFLQSFINRGQVRKIHCIDGTLYDFRLRR